MSKSKGCLHSIFPCEAIVGQSEMLGERVPKRSPTNPMISARAARSRICFFCACCSTCCCTASAEDASPRVRWRLLPLPLRSCSSSCCLLCCCDKNRALEMHLASSDMASAPLRMSGGSMRELQARGVDSNIFPLKYVCVCACVFGECAQCCLYLLLAK